MIIAVIMGAVVYYVQFLGLALWLTLVIQIVLGIVLYVGLAQLFKLECYMYLKNMIGGYLKKRKKA